MKTQIEIFSYANEIFDKLKSGILLTTKAENKVNSMSISWGSLGIEWSKPIFIAYVRENRFTRYQLDKNPEFTVNVPVGEFDKKILRFCGTESGHSRDKIKELGLTLEEAIDISVPGIRELPLTIECKVIYKQMQDKFAISKEDLEKNYPQDVASTFCGSNKDFHIAYYGEILNAYVIE